MRGVWWKVRLSYEKSVHDMVAAGQGQTRESTCKLSKMISPGNTHRQGGVDSFEMLGYCEVRLYNQCL